MLGFKGRCFIDSEPLLESRADNTGDAWLLLPRWQAEAARAFLQGLRKAIARSKSEAKEEGHALLVRLARGETTVADYEEELGQDRQGDD